MDSAGQVRPAGRRTLRSARRSRFRTSFTAGGVARPTRARIKTTLGLLPPYISQAIVTTDPATGKLGNTGVITFGIRVMPFDQQKRLIDDIRAQTDPPGTALDPPAGVTAQVVGLPVLAADANSSLSGSRYLVTIAGLLAVALVLLRRLPLGQPGAGALDPDRARDRVVVAGALGGGRSPQPDVGHPRGARDRDRHRVQRPALGPLPRGARPGRDDRGGASARLCSHRRRGARLGDHGDRRVRRPGAQRHSHVARLRTGHRVRPRGCAGRGARRPARRTGLVGGRRRPPAALAPAYAGADVRRPPMPADGPKRAGPSGRRYATVVGVAFADPGRSSPP